jgi:hypothetical protein
VERDRRGQVGLVEQVAPRAEARARPITITVRGGTSCSSSAASIVPKPAGWRSIWRQKSATVPRRGVAESASRR